MIELTKLNGDLFILNAFLIEKVESLPDTTITLVNGRKIVVQTSRQDLLEKATTFYSSVGFIGSLKKQVME